MKTSLFPPIRAYRRGRLQVSKIHNIYFEECGNPRGKPIVFLHGGPGGGFDGANRRYFNPRKWRVVLFDQRGCGKSTPHAELRENTTWDLVSDVEKLRVHLGIDRWVVFGGSWGSTLSLAYAESHPARVKGLILRGIFLLRRKELEWFYQEGASNIFPDAWEDFLKPIPPRERGDLMKAYHSRLMSRDRRKRIAAARAWSVWEATTSRIRVDPKILAKFAKSRFAESFARIESHYFVNGGFLEHERQLLTNVKRIRRIPGVIVQGRYDVVCPMVSAWDLHRAWPEAKLIVVPDAGHSMKEPGIAAALIAETEKMAAL